MPFGTIAAAGVASGVNLYATALVLGLGGRMGWAETPEVLQSNGLLGISALLFVVEFVVDKIPWLDSAWDAVHTVIRPVGAAALGVALAGGDAGSAVALDGLVGAVFALSSHGAKASTRAVVNASPEPFSNIALSLAEDGAVVALVSLALAYPVLAGAVAIVIAVTSAFITWALSRSVRRLVNRWRARPAARRQRAP